MNKESGVGGGGGGGFGGRLSGADEKHEKCA